MSERIKNGNFNEELTGWTSQGNLVFDAATGNSIIFNGGNGNPSNGVLTQEIKVTPGQTGTISFKYGKIGNSELAARVGVHVFYEDENGERQTLAFRFYSDDTGPTYEGRTPSALGKTGSFQFDVPEGITSAKVEFTDMTRDGKNTDLAVDSRP